MRRNLFVLIVCLPVAFCRLGGKMASAADTAAGRFITAEMMARLRDNANTDAWTAAGVQTISAHGEFWRTNSDRELWDLMFGPTLTRSWMVYSNGFCPSCKEDVPMYRWQINARQSPWKVACPHCEEQFPKNDFAAFHRSGLDANGVFDPAKADRTLLFNTEHPDPNDPLHHFGVDDGEGYVDGQHTWRFIGAYLIYGQWKQLVLGGITSLSQAYVATGETVYARKAAILLDRVADLYPHFDYRTQAFAYERPAGGAGYVSVWHDACEETRELAQAYDRIRDALTQEAALVTFLSAQAGRYQLENPKANWEDIRRNIEERILKDALAHPAKINSNYPRFEVARAVITAVLGGPGAEEATQRIVDAMLRQATAVDGVTGEKGMANYTANTIATMAEYLAMRARSDPDFLPDMLVRHPRLRQTYRFHIDTWCLQRYFPNIGDSHGFAHPITRYPGMFIQTAPTHRPSMFTFLWQLYQATGDPAYVQVLYHANDGQTHNLPYDLFADDPTAFRREVQQVIDQHGAEIDVGSVNKEEWALAILRSGTDARALWLDYDTGGGAHAHSDAMNLGLFAKGLDLMPDYGYPPVQYEPWRQRAYYVSTSHNTVTVDKRDNWGGPVARGTTTLWADGTHFRAIRAAMQNDPLPLPRLRGDLHAHVGLYAYTPARFRAVRVWTRADDAEEWTLQFTDDFGRDTLGPDWKVIQGDWRIQDGWLTGHGRLICTRPLPGQQRLEYEAVSDEADAISDLSALLASDSAGNGVFFGFGSDYNTHSKLLMRDSRLAVRSDARIVPGQRYHMTALLEDERLGMWANGTLILDCENLENPGLNRIFGDGDGARQYERTAAMIDISPRDAYVVDVFRVVGGEEHARFFHSTFGTITTTGLALNPGRLGGYGGAGIRNFRTDSAPEPGWQVEWAIEDRYRLVPADTNVHLRHTDLTTGSEAWVAEGWVNAGSYNTAAPTWIPRMVTRRSGPEPLASTFVAVIEPYTDASHITAIRRLPVTTPDGVPYGDSTVAVEITLADGQQDLLIAADTGNPLRRRPSLADDRIMAQPEWGVHTDGELCLVRRDAAGRVSYAALSRGHALQVGELTLTMPAEADTFVERDFREQTF